MDPTFILLIVALGAFIVFQIFQGRKRRRETDERQSKFLPGAEIMTNYGLYGTILTLDDETNVATIETTPGTVLKIHRQTILKIADYDDVPAAVEAEDDRLDSENEHDESAASVPVDSSDDRRPSSEPRFSEPQFGERVDGHADGSVEDDRPGTDKPATRPFQKGDE